MIRKRFKNIIILILFSVIISSCVSQKKFQSLEKEHISLQESYNTLETKTNELESYIKQLKNENNLLQTEVDKANDLKETIARLENKHKETEDLLNQFKANNKNEIGALLKQLQEEKDELQKKEKELQEQNNKLIALKKALKNKEEAVQVLKNKVASALTRFEGKGLSVIQKNGKVYVSMDEKLLFKSGKYNVEPNGVKALKQLAELLEKNPDINIMVEGHTDSLAYQGSGNLIDNWDLSVKRATSVVRSLLDDSKISPKRVIAAGQSEFAPISTNNTIEGRQKNRRTEIILTPKVEELLKMLEEN